MPTLRLYYLLSLLLFPWPTVVHATIFEFTEWGMQVEEEGVGKFFLEYPVLLDESQQPKHRLLGKNVHGKTASLQYEDGGSAELSVTEAGEATWTFAGLAPDVKYFKTSMLIPLAFGQGGRWKLGQGAGDFPAAVPAQPIFARGNANSFQLINDDGRTFDFHLPEYSYQQLQDNRAWNWSTYVWTVFVPRQTNRVSLRIAVTNPDVNSAAGAAKPAVLVDQFGQTIKTGEWPGKIKGPGEFATDIQADDVYYSSLHPPATDRFGGLPDSRAKLGLKATGFFHVEKQRDKWYLADPDGNAFFHLGVCSVSPGDDYTLVRGRERLYEWLPSPKDEYKSAFLTGQGDGVFSFYLANLIRKYRQPYSLENFHRLQIDRLRRWGFNSIGAFTAPSPVFHEKNIPYVAFLPLDRWNSLVTMLPGVSRVWDPFDEANVSAVETSFARELPMHASDPLLIGYFLVNEPLYEDVPKIVPGLPGKFACKRRLVEILVEKYKTPAAFSAAWNFPAQNFDELADAKLLVQTSAAAADMHAFMELFFEEYFRVVAEKFHQHDRHHLLIGNRLQPGTINNEQLCRISGKYLDVISFNYYTDSVDKDLLNKLHGWTGDRPMMLSEFFWAAPTESGLLGGREAASQQERGLAYRNYVEQAASLGYIIGVEWFTLVDQAATGRWFEGLNGERANTGLLSVADRPYQSMLAEMSKTNYDVYRVLSGERPPFKYDQSRFRSSSGARRTAVIPSATGPIVLDGGTQHWPGIPPEILGGQQLVMGGNSNGLEATFKLTWDDQNLYVLVNVVDPTPGRNNHSGATLWQGDCVELFLGSQEIDQGGPLRFTDHHLLLGGVPGKRNIHDANAAKQSDCGLLVTPGSDGKSYSLEVAVPWTMLSIQPTAGTKLLFDLAVDDSADGDSRLRQLMWSGSNRNSGDRSRWAVITLK